MDEETTIAAIATSPGEGGIGIIRISGIDACCIADKIFQARGGKFAESTPYLMRFGHVVRGDKTIVDEGLAVFMKAPHSYTEKTSSKSRSTDPWKPSVRHSRSSLKTAPSRQPEANSRNAPS